MSVSSDKKVDYQKLRAELEEIIAELQSGDLPVDEAMKKHERAEEISSQIEAFLETAENKITELKKKSSKQ